MFERLGRGIAGHPVLFLLVWAAAVGAGAIWSSLAEPVPLEDVGSFLPADAPNNQAIRLVEQAFPKLAARSHIVIIAQRNGGLTDADFRWLNDRAERIAERTGRLVLSPSVGFLRHRLVSPDQQAAIVVVNLPTNFISTGSIAAVEQVEEVIGATASPAGVTTAITGTAGVGRDYSAATTRALHNTTWVTIVAVLVILIVVYRSPVGALVPLVSIGASVYLAFVVLALLQHRGWQIATMERIFAVVLIFGAGVDFALFWIARYREGLQSDLDFDTAAIQATHHVGPAILASAATTICGLSTLIAADLLPMQNSGKVLAVVLIIALLAALTLAPALARLLGRGLFWPMGVKGGVSLGQRYLWPRLAYAVTHRPRRFLLVGLVVLAIPAVWLMRIEPRFDALSELPPGSSSSLGFDIACEHFSKGQLYSNTLLLRFEEPPASMTELETAAETLAEKIAKLDGVHDVYSPGFPLGRKQARAASLIGPALKPLTRSYYVSPSQPVLRFEILIDHLPFSPTAMAIIENVHQMANETATTLTASGRKAEVFMAGPTPYVLAVREVAGEDQLRVMILATVVIALIVLVLVRDVPLTLFMVLATWVTYGATLTLAQFFFVHVLGQPGLDWKVRLIVFVIIVAVGQDYNIFLVTRLLQEPSDISEPEAARRAIVSTGSVISSCGIIMAATLGSLWAGRLLLLQQIGFSLALGILIDAYFVRPLLLPSFFLASGRRRTAGRQWQAPEPKNNAHSI